MSEDVMSKENLSLKKSENVSDLKLVEKVRQRGDTLINLGFLQGRISLITTGILIVATTYGIEYSGVLVNKLKRRKK